MSREARIRAEAIELLACLASQPNEAVGLPGCPEHISATLPGPWSDLVRDHASIAVVDTICDELDWREAYAEAEAQLREAADAG